MTDFVLFDLDGTLLDRDASVRRFVDAQYDRMIHFFGHIPKDAFMQRFIELDDHGYVWKDKVYQSIIDEFGISGMTWEELLEDYLQQFYHNCMPFAGVHDMLAELKKTGRQLGLITNGKTVMQQRSIKALGIDKYFSVILISEQEGIKKPEPEIFRRALSRLNALSENSVYIGDHPVNDIAAAKAVGMKTIWKRNGMGDAPSCMDAAVSELDEIPKVLTGL